MNREGFRRAVLDHPSNSDPVTIAREDEEGDFPCEQPEPRPYLLCADSVPEYSGEEPECRD